MCGQVARENRPMSVCGLVNHESRPFFFKNGQVAQDNEIIFIFFSFSFSFSLQAYYARH
jgi:hypothetical protein